MGNEFKNTGKDIKKQMIIDTAIKTFHQKGYRSATLEDIAQELGLTRPAIYHYFPSKEDLLSQIYLQALEQFFNTIYEIKSMELQPPEKLKIFISRHLNNVVIENIPMFTVFFSEENQLAEKDFQKILKEKRKFTRVLENIIIDGIEQDYFRQVNPKLQASAIIGMCNWLYRWYKPGKSLFGPDEIVREFTSLLEKGLVREKTQSVHSDILEPPGAQNIRPRTRSQILKDLKACNAKITNLLNELEKTH